MTEYKEYIGKPVVELATKLNKGKFVYRIIKPGQPCTAEIRMDRLTIHVDKDMNVTSIKTG